MTHQEYEAKKAETIAGIQSAFDGVERGKGPTLHEAIAIDRYDGPQEERVARRRDNETQWQDIPQDVLEQVPEAAAYLSPAGYRYYLPAFLIWHIQESDGGNSPETATFDPRAFFYIALLEYGPDDMSSNRNKGINILSAEQSRAVAQFLEFEVIRAGYYFDLFHKAALGQSEDWEVTREIEVDFLSSGAQSALEKYWGQFLP